MAQADSIYIVVRHKPEGVSPVIAMTADSETQAEHAAIQFAADSGHEYRVYELKSRWAVKQRVERI